MNGYVGAGLTVSSVSGIIMKLDPSVCGISGDGALVLALRTLASALRLLPPDHRWTVSAGENGAALAFHVTPLPGQRVSTLDAWNLIHLLREQPDVLTAEPAFVANQNNLVVFA